MNILVFVKQTFDTEETVVVQGGRVSEDNVRFVLNPYDEYAVEQAVQVKEEFGGEVTVVAVGQERMEQALRTALAMGADKAALVEDDGSLDEYGVAKVLAAFARRGTYDLLFAGQATVDGASAQTGPRVAEELGVPVVAAILRFTLEGDRAVVERDMEGYSERLSVPLPALFTAQQGLNEPRYPTLPNVMKAKKKPLERLTLEDLGLARERLLGRTATVECFVAPKTRQRRMLQGSPEAQAQALADELRRFVLPD
ncbi:MAG: electron transfer flavoprotein subunit beta/FixA family protein [Alicyclobacillaceae bacterium]|nr:electron transfer flavoprotein subunit beta/FixA family protein [Alicyclobacillaceae bacterium]